MFTNKGRKDETRTNESITTVKEQLPREVSFEGSDSEDHRPTERTN